MSVLHQAVVKEEYQDLRGILCLTGRIGNVSRGTLIKSDGSYRKSVFDLLVDGKEMNCRVL